MIPYGRQNLSEDDIRSVVDVLRSDWLTQGPTVARFEAAIAKYVGSQYAVAVSSGTAALHLGCRALGLKRGGMLWTSPNTFVASANCAFYCNGDVSFVDIGKDTFNISPTALEKKLIEAKQRGQLPDILVPVHFAGQPCDMKEIFALAKEYDCKIVEDASHAIGAEYHDSKIGSCQYSELTTFSFHPVKLMTTGEGGAITTNDKGIYDKLMMLRSHGIIRDPDRMNGTSEGDWYYQQLDLGYNYRITDIQAALGISQLSRLDQFLKKRQTLVRRYHNKLSHLPVKLPIVRDARTSAWHLYVIRVDEKKTGKTRGEVFAALRKSGVGVNVHYIPVHTHPYYAKKGFQKGDYPVSEKYYEEAISIPIFYDMTEDEQDRVIRALEQAL